MKNELNSSETLTPLASNRRSFVKGLAGAATCLIGLALVSKRTRGFPPQKTLVGLGKSSANATAWNAGALDPQLPYIYWTFGQISRGDCTIAPGSTFYLYANGATRWVCDLRSSDSGDEWDGRFDITNISGQVLASTPNYHFDISQDNVTRHWDESRGPNASLAAAYSQARGISFVCSC